MKFTTKKLALGAMLIAISVLLVLAIHFPIFPAAAFLEYDPADIPILIGTFIYGPVMGLILTVAASVIQGLTVSAKSGLYGILMHIIATGTFVIVAGCIYSTGKSKKRAAIALVCATVASVIIMAIANLVITPLFMGVPRSAVMSMLLPIIVPFNAIKFGINSVITFAVYKPVSKWIRKESKKKSEALDNSLGE